MAQQQQQQELHHFEHQVRRWSAPEGSIPRFSRRSLLDDDTSAAGGTDLATDATVRVLDGNLRVPVYPPRVAEAVSRALSGGNIGEDEGNMSEPKGMRDDGDNDSDDASDSAAGGSAAPAASSAARAKGGACRADGDNHTTSFVDHGTVFEDDEEDEANQNELEASADQCRRQTARLSTAAKEEGLALCRAVFGKEEGTEVYEEEGSEVAGGSRRASARRSVAAVEEGAALCRTVLGADGEASPGASRRSSAAGAAASRRSSAKAADCCDSEVNDSVGACRRVASGLGHSLGAQEVRKSLGADEEGAALCRLVLGSRAAGGDEEDEDDETAPVAAGGAGRRRASDGSCSAAAAAGSALRGGAAGGEGKAAPAASAASSTTAADGASSEDSSSSPTLPAGAGQVASQSGKVVRSVVLDFQSSVQPWSVRWRFEEVGAFVKQLTKSFPRDQELYVGDELVAINQVNVRGKARKEIESAWRHEQVHNRFVCLKFEGPPALAALVPESY